MSNPENSSTSPVPTGKPKNTSGDGNGKIKGEVPTMQNPPPPPSKKKN